MVERYGTAEQMEEYRRQAELRGTPGHKAKNWICLLYTSPNFFGLSIAYDPYMREVVQADSLTTCGGDGGCNICGGLGPFLGFLPLSLIHI